jgi:hypothetical protein
VSAGPQRDPELEQTALRMLTGEVERRGLLAEVDGSALVIPRGDGTSIGFGAGGLVQLLRKAPITEWRGLSERVVDALLSVPAAEASPAGYEAARPHLRVSLLPSGVRRARSMTARPVAEGLIEVLTWDMPQLLHRLSRAMTDHWGVSDEEAFGLARAQTQTQPLRVEPAPGRLGEAGGVLLAGDLYAATQLLWLAERVEVPEEGALVTAPREDVALVVPIRGPEAAASLPVLCTAAHCLYEAGPWPLCPRVFWWRAGSMQALIDVAIVEGEVGLVLLPDALAARLSERGWLTDMMELG